MGICVYGLSACAPVRDTAHRGKGESRGCRTKKTRKQKTRNTLDLARLSNARGAFLLGLPRARHDQPVERSAHEITGAPCARRERERKRVAGSGRSRSRYLTYGDGERGFRLHVSFQLRESGRGEPDEDEAQNRNAAPKQAQKKNVGDQRERETAKGNWRRERRAQNDVFVQDTNGASLTTTHTRECHFIRFAGTHTHTTKKETGREQQ